MAAAAPHAAVANPLAVHYLVVAACVLFRHETFGTVALYGGILAVVAALPFVLQAYVRRCVGC